MTANRLVRGTADGIVRVGEYGGEGERRRR
jgi:hypothetical protein